MQRLICIALSGSLDDRLDDELLIKKMVRNPSMKTLMVILERCETKEALEDYYRANVGNAGERSAGKNSTYCIFPFPSGLSLT